jgi:hypothetical protein
MSLHTGGPVATAVEPVINPHNLKILGWWCKAPGGKELVLLADNVREVMANGLAINDEGALSTPDELVRFSEILDIRFQLVDKLVKTKRQKLGKVSDYSYNDGFFVQKLYVARSLVKVFSSDDTLLIDRTQVLEVTDHYILVRDSDVKVSEEEVASAFGAATA